MQNKNELLANSLLFGGLPAEQLREIAAIGVDKKYGKGKPSGQRSDSPRRNNGDQKARGNFQKGNKGPGNNPNRPQSKPEGSTDRPDNRVKPPVVNSPEGAENAGEATPKPFKKKFKKKFKPRPPRNGPETPTA